MNSTENQLGQMESTRINSTAQFESQFRSDAAVAPPSLSILILIHNSEKFLRACLESIPRNVSCSHEVLVLDNGSKENKCEDIAQRYPWLHVIRSEKNLGFNAGNNLLAKRAKGRHFLLLNIDTILLSDVTPAVHLLESNCHIGVVGAEAYEPTLKVRPSAGRFPRPWRLWLFRNLWMIPRMRYGHDDLHARKVDWVEGSFFMTSSENWAAVGGFEEQNFMYGNDVDFCRSMRQHGLFSVQCADTKYIHFGGYALNRMKCYYASHRRYHEKFSGRIEQVAANLFLRVGLIGRIVVYTLWYRLTNNKEIADRLHWFSEVHRNWSRLLL
jgi:hypothetical protein